MKCTLCGKRVDKRYWEAHKQYHQEELEIGVHVPTRFHTPRQLAIAEANRKRYKRK